MHPRGHHAVDIAQRFGQLLRQREDIAHALFGRRRHQSLLLEYLAQRRKALAGQPFAAQDLQRGGQLRLVDAHAPAGLAGADLVGIDAFGGQHRQHLVGLGLVQRGIQVDAAGGQQQRQRQRGNTDETGQPEPARGRHGRSRRDRRHCWFLSRLLNRLVPALPMLDVTWIDENSSSDSVCSIMA